MEPNIQLARLGTRLTAVIIDFFAVLFLNYFISSILLKPFGGLLGAMGLKDFQFGEDLVKGAFAGFSAIFVLFFALIGALIFAFLYDFLLVASPLKATLGKKLMRIKVVNTDGQSIEIGAAFMRSLLKFVSVFFWLIPWLFAIFTKKKQAIHDLMTYSIVIKSEND